MNQANVDLLNSMKKLYGDGNLSFELDGAEDARFTDPALYWTYDIKTLASIGLNLEAMAACSQYSRGTIDDEVVCPK